MPGSDAIIRKQRDYAATFKGEISFPISGLGLAKLCLRALVSRKAMYQVTFKGGQNRPHVAGQAVLDDLRRLAGMDHGGLVNSPVSRSVDPYATCYRAGLRDAYLRIVKFLGLTEADLKEIAEHDRTN